MLREGILLTGRSVDGVDESVLAAVGLAGVVEEVGAGFEGEAEPRLPVDVLREEILLPGLSGDAEGVEESAGLVVGVCFEVEARLPVEGGREEDLLPAICCEVTTLSKTLALSRTDDFIAPVSVLFGDEEGEGRMLGELCFRAKGLAAAGVSVTGLRVELEALGGFELGCTVDGDLADATGVMVGFNVDVLGTFDESAELVLG